MQAKIRRQLLLFIDLALVATATVAALVLRDNFEVSASRLQDLLPYLGLTLLAATVVLLASGAHRTIWRFSAMADYLRVLAGVLLTVLGAVVIGFLLNRLDGVARALPIIQALLMVFLLVGVRVGMRLRHARRHQSASGAAISSLRQQTVLIVGLNSIAELFLRSVDEFAAQRVKIAGIAARNPRHSGRLFQQHSILGVPEEIERILKTLELHGVTVDRIVVTTPFAELSLAAQQALLDIENTSDIRVDFFAEQIGLDDGSRGAPKPTKAAPVDGNEPDAVFHVADLEARRPYWHGKRFIDLTLALALITALAPVIVLVAFMAVLDVGFPAVFWQQRPGARGRPFKLYKFRTMGNAHDELGHRIPDAQRLSGVGELLRRTRLDELPQLYNILMGEMSFVGPRPLLPVDQPSGSAARLLVRPGLTGWAQVNGGRGISPSDKSALDVWYVRNASLWVDIKIVVKTVPMLLFGERTDTEKIRQAWNELSGNQSAKLVGQPPAVPSKGCQHAA